MKADLVAGGRIVTHYGVFDDAWLAVKDGKIAAIGAKGDMPAAERTEDYGKLLILPGVVDTHTHSLGVVDEGHWNSTSAAAFGGVTTINDHPLDLGGAPISTAELLDKERRTQPEALVDFALLAGGMPDKLEAMEESANSGATGYKMLMHTTSGALSYGMRAVTDAELYSMFQVIAKTGQVGFVHAENESMINMLVERWIREGKTYPAAHHETRPEVVETAAVAVAIEFARALGMRLHLVHLSVPRSIDLVTEARKEGVLVTNETCPHYLLCNDERWKEVGSRFRINPPLRGEAARQALWKQVRDGRVHMIGSDHAPHPGKLFDNIFESPSGSPGIETMLPLVFSEGVAKGQIDLVALTKLLSYHPARLLGIYPQKGAIQVGADADFVVFDEKKTWTVEGSKLRSQGKWSLYEGMPVTGKVVGTYVRGTKVFAEGDIVGKKGHGVWVKKVRNYDLP